MHNPDRLSLLRRPVIAALLPVVVTATAILLAWLAYYSPATNHYETLTGELRNDIEKVDQILKRDKEEHRRLNLANLKISSVAYFDQVNAHAIDQVNDLSAIIQGNAQLITLNRADTLNLTLEKITPAGFYDMIETFEAEPYVDRVTINTDKNMNNRYLLSLYLKKQPEVEP